MTEPKTGTLSAPGAILHYDVRAADASTEPILLIIGSPMGADGFVTLAGHFTDRTVVTYDPRGAGRSPRTDGALVTAVEMVAEVGDLTRFGKPREVMGYLGLVPSEDSTGDKRRQGSITKTGNGHARRSRVESAWAYARPPRLTRALKQRQQGLSREVIEISWRAQVRLCGRYRRLSARGKNKKKIIVAIARELCAFMWAIAIAAGGQQVPARAS